MNNQPTREPGYYHLTRKGKEIIGEWWIVSRTLGYWRLTGSQHRYYDSDFDSIGERVERVKDSVSVPVATVERWSEWAYRIDGAAMLAAHIEKYLPEPPKQ